jgi:hypothetical protein
VLNQLYSKEEYEKFLSKIKLSSARARRQMIEQAKAFARWHPVPHQISRNAENASGNQLFDCENVMSSFFIRGGQDLIFCDHLTGPVRSCADVSFFGRGAEDLYECAMCGIHSSRLLFCYECWDGGRDLCYCAFCPGSQNCFGCVGLKKREYCILNKQYSREEYARLVPKLVEHMRECGEWGEFFPLRLSPVPYNRSLAQRFFPMTEDETLSIGLRWFVEEPAAVDQIIPAKKLPDEFPEEDRSLIVESARSKKAFRIIGEEINHYRNLSAPLPRISYFERMDDRAKILGAMKLFPRVCAKSQKALETTYPPDAAWTVWERGEYEKEF